MYTCKTLATIITDSAFADICKTEMKQTLLSFGQKTNQKECAGFHPNLDSIRDCQRCFTITALRKRCSQAINVATGQTLGIWGTKEQLLARLIKYSELRKNVQSTPGKSNWRTHTHTHTYMHTRTHKHSFLSLMLWTHDLISFCLCCFVRVQKLLRMMRSWPEKCIKAIGVSRDLTKDTRKPIYFFLRA